MSKEAMKLALEDYLSREMPAGTVIGDPKWWAGKIANVLAKQEQGEPVSKDQWWAKELEGFWGDSDYQVTLDTRRAAKTALTIIFDHPQPKQEQERCVGCEACIDTACGRDECPKGWPKAAQPEQEPVLAAMKTVIESMQQDPDYAWGWHCNIAMSFVDAGGDHYTGNQGAARFMRTLANVEPAHELPSPPPQRTWVGLDWSDLPEEWVGNLFFKQGARWAEAKLNEKNT